MLFPEDVVLLSVDELVALKQAIDKLCLALLPRDPQHPEQGEYRTALGACHHRALIDAGLRPFYDRLDDLVRERELGGG